MLQVRVCRIAGDAELLADIAGVAFGGEQPEYLGLAPREFAALDKLCSSETTAKRPKRPNSDRNDRKHPAGVSRRGDALRGEQRHRRGIRGGRSRADGHNDGNGTREPQGHGRGGLRGERPCHPGRAERAEEPRRYVPKKGNP